MGEGEAYGLKEVMELFRIEVRSEFASMNSKIEGMRSELGRQSQEIENIKGRMFAYGTLAGVVGAVGAALILRGMGA